MVSVLFDYVFVSVLSRRVYSQINKSLETYFNPRQFLEQRLSVRERERFDIIC